MSVSDNHPVHAFPSGIRDLVIELHQQTQAPFALNAASVLGAISLVCQDKLKMQRLPGLEPRVAASRHQDAPTNGSRS